MGLIYLSTSFYPGTPSDLAAALDFCQDLPIDGLELASTHAFRPDFAEIIRAKNRHPLLIHNYFPPAPEEMILNLASGDKEIRNGSIKHMLYCLEFAASIKAQIYTIHPGFLAQPLAAAKSQGENAYDFTFSAQKDDYDQSFNRMVEALITLLERAQHLGVNLAIETEGSIPKKGLLLMERPEEYTRLFKLLPDSLKINFNIAHTQLAGQAYGFNPLDLLDIIKPRIVAAEISHHDYYNDLHQPLRSDSPALKLVKSLGNIPLILEVRDAKKEQIIQSLDLLRQTLKEA